MAKKHRKQTSTATSTSASDIIKQGEPHWYRPGKTWFVDGDHTFSGESVDSDSAMSCITAYACSKALSETIAGLPGIVYQMVGDMVKKEAYDSKAYELLAVSPNDEMDSFTFWELLVNRVVNSGNFFCEIQRDKQDRPVALWPIHPSRVRPIRDGGDGTLYWEITGDYVGQPEYEDPSWRREHLYYLSNHNFLNIVGFGSINGIIAPGVLPAANELAIDKAVKRYGGGFFARGASLTGVVEHPGFINEPDKREIFRKDINRIHNNRSGDSIGVLWQGAKFQAVSISPEQAQFLQTRKFTIGQICSFYGVPPSIIGDYSESKFATADAMIRAFVMITLRNLATRIERAIARQILNVRGEDGKLTRAFSKPMIYQIAMEGLLRGDPKTQAETFRIMREGGAISTNEWRQETGWNPVGKHGDYLIVPGGYTRLDNIDNQGTRVEQQQQAPAPQQDQQKAVGRKSTKNRAQNEIGFDRARLIECLEEVIHKERPTVQVAVDPTPVFFETLVDMTKDAVERIHKITMTQIERWREQNPAEVDSKIAEFAGKQKVRLSEALQSCRKLAEKCEVRTEPVVEAYGAIFQGKDSHSIFSIPAEVNLQIAELLQ